MEAYWNYTASEVNDTVALQLKAVEDNHTATGSNDSQPAMLGTEMKSSEA